MSSQGGRWKRDEVTIKVEVLSIRAYTYNGNMGIKTHNERLRAITPGPGYAGPGVTTTHSTLGRSKKPGVLRADWPDSDGKL